MRLVVGLGNPGPEYAWTPHNLGFLVVDRLAERAGIRVERPAAKSYIGRGRIAGIEAVLAKPQTFMNASGMAVRELAERFAEGPEEIVIVTDDVALPWGMVRIRERGSGGGHNGLESVVSALGTEEFVRVRVGIGPDHPVRDLAAYVLHPVPRALREDVLAIADEAAGAVETVLAEGAPRAMAKFNRRVPPAGPEPGSAQE
jgi:PTH1 family peptidyl-tRNA hydrolase